MCVDSRTEWQVCEVVVKTKVLGVYSVIRGSRAWTRKEVVMSEMADERQRCHV